MSHHTGLPAVFVRKTAKPYGTAKLAEGGSVTGKRLVVIKDVVTPAKRCWLPARRYANKER